MVLFIFRYRDSFLELIRDLGSKETAEDGCLLLTEIDLFVATQGDRSHQLCDHVLHLSEAICPFNLLFEPRLLKVCILEPLLQVCLIFFKLLDLLLNPWYGVDLFFQLSNLLVLGLQLVLLASDFVLKVADVLL